MATKDIKTIISELVEKIAADEALKAQFQKEPVKAVEKMLGVDLPDEMVEKVIDGVKAKLTVDQLGNAASLLKKLF